MQRGLEQGDQNGRIFAYWASVYIGQFLENYLISPRFWGYVVFSMVKVMYILCNLEKMVGPHFGTISLKKLIWASWPYAVQVGLLYFFKAEANNKTFYVNDIHWYVMLFFTVIIF
jgi:hypothetical protein